MAAPHPPPHPHSHLGVASPDIDPMVINLIYENFFLYDLENCICKIYATEIEKSFLLYGIITFSGKPMKNKTVSLILPRNKLKFDVERDTFLKKLSFELEK